MLSFVFGRSYGWLGANGPTVDAWKISWRCVQISSCLRLASSLSEAQGGLQPGRDGGFKELLGAKGITAATSPRGSKDPLKSNAFNSIKISGPEAPFPTTSPIAEWEQSEETKAARRQYLNAVLSAGKARQLEHMKSQAAEQNQQREEQIFADAQTGYAALGGHVPSTQDIYGDDKPLRLHPGKMFIPGMKYKPEDLTLPGVGTRRPFMRPGPGFTNEEALQQVDFKNLAFLNKFVTTTGRLLPRRQTKLKQKVHRRVCREIKLARQMGLLPFTSRRADFVRRRAPEQWIF